MKLERITLISPSKDGERAKKEPLPNYALSVLAGLTPSDIEVELLHETVDDIDYDKPRDLVGISAFTTSIYQDAVRIAKEFRTRGIPVTVGGAHPTFMTEEALQDFDIVVRGEAEELWPQLLTDLQIGNFQRVYESNRKPSLEGISPRRDLLDPNKFWTPNTVQTSRGCVHGCKFCSVHKFNGRAIRHRPLDEVEEEIKSLNGNLIIFLDDNLFADPEYLIKLAERLKPLKKRWGAQTDWQIGKKENGEYLSLASESGCSVLFIGFETLSQQSQREANKGWNITDKFIPAIENIHSKGISICGSLMYGFDTEPPNVYEETIEFAQRYLDLANFTIQTPLVGTNLFYEMESKGRLTTKDWSLYDGCHVVYVPKSRSAEEILRDFYNSYKEFYSGWSILQRLPRNIRNLNLVLPLSLVYNRRFKRIDEDSRQLEDLLQQEATQSFLDKAKQEAEAVYCFASQKKKDLVEYAALTRNRVVARLSIPIAKLKGPLSKTHSLTDRLSNLIRHEAGVTVIYGPIK